MCICESSAGVVPPKKNTNPFLENFPIGIQIIVGEFHKRISTQTLFCDIFVTNIQDDGDNWEWLRVHRSHFFLTVSLRQCHFTSIL